MAIGCSAKCAKAMLLIFTLFFWISGCCRLLLGTWLFIDPRNRLYNLIVTDDVTPDAIYYLAYSLLTLGALVLLFGLFGCCGALQENRCLLVANFVFLFGLLCVEVALAVVALVYRTRFLAGLEERLMDGLVNRYGYDTLRNDPFTQAIDMAQYKFNCCGVNGGFNYVNSRWYRDSQRSSEKRNVPVTCCVLANRDELSSNIGSPNTVVTRVFSGTVEEPWQHPQPQDETACQSTDSKIFSKARYTKGCLQEVVKWFRTDTTIMIVMCIGMAIYLVIGMVLSICLCRRVGGTEEQEEEAAEE